MSIISKPSQIQKNIAATFELLKNNLSQVSSVDADSYFRVQQNWSKVVLNYESSVGSQFEIVSFDATQSNPTASFLVSEYAREAFEIQSIFIIDFDNGVFVIPRSELNAQEFDITLV